jgi:hypothetical protein
MNILGKARKLESTLARHFDRAAQQWSKTGPRGPLEVLHGILQAVDDRVEPAGRGTHVFPFNRLKVTIVAASRDARARFVSVVDSDPTLQARIAARLRERGCDAAGVLVRISYVPQAERSWESPEYHVDFSQGAPAELPAPEPGPAHEITLTVTNGAADKADYSLTMARINLGRCEEVRDNRNRLIRTNHVVFKDAAGSTNDTVSRRHAHIDYHERSGDYRLSDDRSAYGTSIVRNGSAIEVPAGSRGIRLQTGDEIVLGEARLKVKLQS